MSQKMPNESSTMSHLPDVRTATDLAANQEEVEHPDDEVEPAEADQGEDRAARADHAAGAVTGPEQSVDEPGLAPELGRHPANGGGDEWKRNGEHERPSQRRCRLEAPAHPLDVRQNHEKKKKGAQARHDVKRVVEELDVVRPLFL